MDRCATPGGTGTYHGSPLRGEPPSGPSRVVVAIYSVCGQVAVRDGPVEVGLQSLVDGLEGEDGGDSGQVEAVVEQLADLSETDEISPAVAAGPA